MPFRVIRRPRTPAPHAQVPELSPAALLALVKELAVPRPIGDIPANQRAAQIVRGHLEALGRRVVEHGTYKNLVALPPPTLQTLPPPRERALTIVSAHFDSVEDTPGADDNASAVAVMIGVARALRRLDRDADVGYIAWNAEEMGIVGSEEWAREWAAAAPSLRPAIREVHVLEMLGFCSHAKGSQQTPPGLLSKLGLPTTADFIGVLGNHRARKIVARVVDAAADDSAVDVVALQTYFGVERLLPSLDLSDHVRLWAVGIPAVLWTDTAFYRNPHYHQGSDTPATLDPAFLSGVAHLIFDVLVSRAT